MAFLIKIYCKFTAESAKLQARKLIASRAQCVWALSQLKHKGLATRYLEYGKKQLLLTIVTF